MGERGRRNMLQLFLEFLRTFLAGSNFVFLLQLFPHSGLGAGGFQSSKHTQISPMTANLPEPSPSSVFSLLVHSCLIFMSPPSHLLLTFCSFNRKPFLVDLL